MRISAAMAGLAALGAWAAGCSDEPPDPSANLRHPSGLAYVDRGTAQGQSRADLYIADPEAEGVRVRQYLRANNSEGQLVTVDTFVPSEVIFIPLVIAAPGFPEELSAAVTTTAPIRSSLYALSPAGVVEELDTASGASVERVGLLHVLDIQQNDYDARAADPGNAPIGVLPLDRLLSEPAIPVDVEVLAAGADRDLVLVAFDPIAEGPGQVALLSVKVESDAVSLLASATATVAAHPRALLHDGSGRVLVSSAGSPSISELTVDLTGASLLGTRDLPAGGPTQGLVALPGFGALALRIDRSAAMVYTSSTGRFERSTAVFPSPFTPRGEQVGTPSAERSGEPNIGRIDLRSSPVVAGAFGRVPYLKPSSTLPSALSDEDTTQDPDGVERADVTLLAHVDGRLSFLVGRPPRLATLSSAQVDGLIDLAALTGTPSSTSGPARISECSELPVPRLTTLGTFGCPASLIPVNQAAERRFRAVYQGTLWSGSGGVLSPIDVAAGRWTLRDGNVADYTALKIGAGDRLRLEHHGTDCSATPAPARDFISEAVVSTVAADRVEIVVTGDLLGLQEPCEEIAAWYEVYPSGNEVVFAEADGGTVRTVLARVPVVDVGGVPTARIESDLAFTFTGPFACAELAQPRLCSVSAECGGRVCAPNSDGVGPGSCSGECPEGAATCVAALHTRSCSGVEILTLPSSPLTVDARGDLARAGSVPRAVAPAAAVFGALRGAWFVTYPGSRTLATVETLPEAVQISYAR